MNASATCFVLWSPPVDEIPMEAGILSFLPPLQESELLSRMPDRNVVTMSRVMDEIGADARGLYVDLVAEIGLFRLPDGCTLRAALGREGATSLWWYHPVAHRNSEGDPTYTLILTVLAILRQAKAMNADALHLVTPPAGVSEALGKAFGMTVTRGQGPLSAWLDVIRGLLGRVPYFLRMLNYRAGVACRYRPPRTRMDVALQGFWDWSVSVDEKAPDRLKDRYFGVLADELRRRGRQVAYWCWYDPASRPGGGRRSHGDVLSPLSGRHDVLLLTALLTTRDILAASLNFRALAVVLGAMRMSEFRTLFEREGIDLYPLFKLPLLRGSVSSGIPQCLLFERAAARAQSLSAPNLLIQFQEHNPSSRAVYAALSNTSTGCWAMQHASYNSSKTYLAFHPMKEFGEQEDGQSVPHPERVCVMGELGRRLFGGCGYAPDRIMPTGSARYDHVRPPELARGSESPRAVEQRALHFLVATSLPARMDFQMLASAVEAARGQAGRISIRLRQHPFDSMEAQAGFPGIATHLEISRDRSLAEDLAWADLVLISQSTVGEEAYLLGKTVWQFRFPYPDQSALAEIAPIPRFYTVRELRDAMAERLLDPAPGPIGATASEVYKSLFQTGDERPSAAIANAVCAMVSRH